MLESDRLHWEKSEVVDQADFLLDEGLAVADAGEQAVVTGFGKGAFANFFFRDKQSAAGFLVGVLRTVGHESGDGAAR